MDELKNLKNIEKPQQSGRPKLLNERQERKIAVIVKKTLS